MSNTQTQDDGNTLDKLLTTVQRRTVETLKAGVDKLRARLAPPKDAEARWWVKLPAGEPRTAFVQVVADVATRAAAAKKMAGDIGKAAIAPHVAKVETVKDALGPLVTAFANIERDAKQMAADVLTVTVEEDRRARETAELARTEAEQRQRDATGRAKAAAAAGDMDTAASAQVQAAEAYMDGAAAKAEAPRGPVPNTVGGLHGRTEWTYEVLDINEVPLYLTRRVVDDDKVQAAIKAGERKVPGLRIFDKLTMSLPKGATAKAAKGTRR